MLGMNPVILLCFKKRFDCRKNVVKKANKIALAYLLDL